MMLPFITVILFFSNLQFCEPKESERNLTGFENHKNWGLLPHGKCGIQSQSSWDSCDGWEIPKKHTERNDVTIEQFPWLANIYRQAYYIEPICSGNIISDKYIITSIFCIRDESPILPMLWVRLGEQYVNTSCSIDKNETCAVFMETIRVESIVKEDTRNKSYNAGLALLRLAFPIHYNKFIQPICLPIDRCLIDMPLEDMDTEIAGWGHYSTQTDQFLYPGDLKSATKRGVDCDTIYPNTNSRFICVANFPQKNPIFAGGRGTPLMKALSRQDSGQSIYHILGIYELYIRDTDKKPFEYTGSFYLRISKYIEWILNNIEP